MSLRTRAATFKAATMNRQRLIISEKLMRQPLLKTVLLIALNACVAAATARANGQRQGSASGTTFRALTQVVNVYAVVRDRQGHLVRDLQRADFQLTEDSVLQSVRYFSQTTDAPLTLGLAIDTTMCQDEALPIEKEAAKDFLREVLRPKDLAFLISFDVNVDLLHDFTNSARELNSAMQTARINAGTGGGGLPGLGGGPVPPSQEVPELGTLLLLGSGVAALGSARLARRRRLGSQ